MKQSYQEAVKPKSESDYPQSMASLTKKNPNGKVPQKAP